MPHLLYRKICDSWNARTPVVTTPIGAEGLFKETYNNNQDYRKIDINNRFYTEEEKMSALNINPRVVDYYNYNK